MAVKVIDGLLETKLHIPTLRPRLVTRPRLFEKLNQGLLQGSRLTLVSAPAGFGKTTLVSEWAGRLRPDPIRDNQIDHGIAWLSLDEGDGDLARFFTYLIVALSRVGDRERIVGKGALGMIQSSQPPPAEDVLTLLVNDMAAAGQRIILILDDYHLIDSSPVDEALSFFLEHLPPRIRLVIVTRDDPQLPLARLRARGQLTELRAAELRFTSSEAAEFLNQVMGLGLSADNIAALESRTEGWIAGLQLAAISMQGQENVASLIDSFTGSHRFVLDYLIEEVLERQPESVQSFLMRTAILSRMTGPLCDALTGQDNGRATLEMLEHANLFVVPLDVDRRWYRYHHLFSDLLRQRLRQILPNAVHELHYRASEWYQQNGFADEAIEHALRSEDFERAADMIEQHVDHALHYGERTRLRRWLDGTPVEVTLSKPHLCILHAANLFISGQVDEAERYLQAAERALDQGTSSESKPVPAGTVQLSPDDKRRLRGRAATVRSFLVSYRGNVQRSIRFARQALTSLPESDLTWRCSAFDSLGTAYSSIGDVDSAHHARLEALEVSQATGSVYMMLFASLRLVVTLRNLGRLRQALEICQQQLKLADENGLSQTALVGWLYALRAEILAERNELDEALKLVNKGVQLTERGNDVALLGSSYLCLMRVLFSRGDIHRASAIIKEVNSLVSRQKLSPWITNQMAAWQARIWLAQGRLDDADRWAEVGELDADGELTPLHDFDHVVFARILIARGRLDESSRLLQRLLEAAETGGRTSKVIELRILQALTLHAGGKTEQALSTLEKALTLSEPEGFVRIFADEGQPMASLLREALDCGIAPDFVRHLLAVISSAEAGQTDDMIFHTDQSGLIEPLSERELEVLQRIAKGFTNREIAERLYLSLNTVKVHTRNIYGKLNVHSRTQAIARAQELGLFARQMD